MRTTIPILLALGAWGCAAEKAQNVSFELAAANQALQHQLRTPEAWSSQTTIYLDEEGGLAEPESSSPVPVAAASTAAKEETSVAKQVQEEPSGPEPPPPTQSEDWSVWDGGGSLPAMASSGPVDSFAVLGLTRAIDEHRQYLTLEARLEDKQRLIDALRSDVEDLSGRSSSSRASAGASP